MRVSNKPVEQITVDQNVVIDKSEILTTTEMFRLILKKFPNVSVRDGLIYGSHNSYNYCLYLKNVSYLGNPHPIYKKRIQIPRDFIDLYNENKKRGIETLLIGVYKYKDVLLFCDFDTTKYIRNKLHNSSAHVYTIDLLNGCRIGLFKKKDYRNNIITVFDEQNITNFLDMKFEGMPSTGIEVFDTLDEFFSSIAKDWYGIECYSEMIENGFSNMYQPEWPGFYLEYKLEKYLKDNHKDHIIKYSQNKKNGDIDLDLFFPQIGIYGDLKTHSLTSGAIQGNDLDTIMNLIKDQSIYYVVCNHTTDKDKDHDYEVTEFWNKQLNKSDLHSYGAKMKHSVSLKNYLILEINKYNMKYLDIFKQGKNSDGKPRNPKIMISNKNINNFLVHIVEFKDE